MVTAAAQIVGVSCYRVYEGISRRRCIFVAESDGHSAVGVRQLRSLSVLRLFNGIHFGLDIIGREAVHELDGLGSFLGVLLTRGSLANVNLSVSDVEPERDGWIDYKVSDVSIRGRRSHTTGTSRS